jgi:hypothetical protein
MAQWTTILAVLTTSCTESPTQPADPRLRIEVVTSASGGVVATDVPTVPGFRVSNAAGRPVSNAAVSFTVEGTDALVEPATVVTGADGVARPLRWRLGRNAGSQALVASVESASARATVTAAPGAPDRLLSVGDTLVVTAAGDTVTGRVRLRVVDRFDNPVPSTPVTWSISRGAVLSAAVATGSDGAVTQPAFVAASTVGRDELTARVASLLRTTPVIVNAGAPASISLGTLATGVRTVGTVVSSALAVSVRDRFGNPVPNASLQVRVSAGRTSTSAVTANATGSLTVDWVARRTPGVDSLIVSAGAARGSTSVTVQVGPAQRLVPRSPLQLTGVTGAPAATPPSVAIVDSCENALPNVALSMTPAEVTHGALVAPPTRTDAAGIATAGGWIFGFAVGTQRIRVVAAGLPPLEFQATVAPLGTTPIIIGSSYNNELFEMPISTSGVDRLIGTISDMFDLITDIAVCPNGGWWLISFGELYSLDRTSLHARRVGALSGGLYNSLACGPDNRLYIAGLSGGMISRVDSQTAVVTPVFSTGSASFDGDLAFAPDGTLYGIVQGTTSRLIRVDLAGNRLLPIAGDADGTGFGSIFGIAFDGPRLFGISANSELISIDLATGKGTFVRTSSVAATGAGVKRQP